MAGACPAQVRLCFAACLTPSALADDFYKGKTINLYIGSGPGGGYDLFGRLVARHIGAHIPGNPTVNPQNLPGAGSINSANFIYNGAPQDGTVLGIGTPSISLLDALHQEGVRFEAAKFNWIGRVGAEINVIFTSATFGIRSIDDARQKEALIGCIANTSPLTLQVQVMDSTLGARFKLIKGYADTNATLLAVERGEVQGARHLRGAHCKTTGPIGSPTRRSIVLVHIFDPPQPTFAGHVPARRRIRAHARGKASRHALFKRQRRRLCDLCRVPAFPPTV